MKGYLFKVRARAFVTFSIFLAILASVAPAQVAVGKRIDSVWRPKSKYFDAVRLLDDVKYLSSDQLEGRSADRPSIELARSFVSRRFREAGLEPFGSGYEQEFSIARRNGEPLKGINFVGHIRGRKHPDKYIVITAHYDHDGVRNGEIYNGADDNASGTAALFALASYFKKNRPRHSLIFVAFDAEEKGLQGSRYFVKNLPVAKESIVLNVNMDMLSRNDKGELYAAGLYHYPQFKRAIEKAQKMAKVKLLTGHDTPGSGRDDWTNQSDHAAFHREKIPFIYFGVEDHKDYHRPTDDYANIQPAFYIGAVETILQAILVLDKQLN